MKKSKTVQLGLVAAIALAACDDNQHCVTDEEGEQHCTEIKHCVTEDGTVVEDNKCDRPGGSPDSYEGAGRPFRWFYGGTSGRIYSPGSRITVISGSNGGG
ncbi:MAG TPA: hypothetical protein VM577_11605, partial [Anaerovoracaceae bacterium]|nr:hypothetical protein [Anaerovoracaceae bacterium]